jgi:hypothetical protein
VDIKDDPWPYIEQEIAAAWREARAQLEGPQPGFLMQAEARYRNGERLYKREWLEWPLDRFEDEAMQELVDWILYKAMRRVKFPEGLA